MPWLRPGHPLAGGRSSDNYYRLPRVGSDVKRKMRKNVDDKRSALQPRTERVRGARAAGRRGGRDRGQPAAGNVWRIELGLQRPQPLYGQICRKGMGQSHVSGDQLRFRTNRQGDIEAVVNASLERVGEGKCLFQ